MTALPGPAEDDPAVAWLAACRPRSVDPGHLPLVRALAAAARPSTRDLARTAARSVALLIAWADTNGLPLAPTVLLDHGNVDRHLREADTSHSDRARRQAWLRRMADAAGVARPVRPRPQHATGPPYSKDDADALLAWADSRPDPQDRHACLAVLALGLGAGLGHPDLLALRGTDASRGPDGTVLVAATGIVRRTVPVLSPYAALVADLCAAAGSGWAVRPGTEPDPGDRMAVRKHINAARPDPRLPVLTPRRARNTWVHGQLTGGTRLDTLAAAAGIADIRTLGGHVPYLAPPAPDDRDRELRRPGRPARRSMSGGERS